MLSSPTFDVILSLVLILALLSIVTSIINEIISFYTKDRAGTLKKSIVKLLRDDRNLDYGELFYNHFTIQSIIYSRKRRQWFGFGRRHHASLKKFFPSYISASTFADVLIDLIARQERHAQKVVVVRDASGQPKKDEHGRKIFEAVPDPPAQSLPDRFRRGLQAMHPSALRDVLSGFADHAGNDSPQLKAQIEDWFSDYQDRVTGWYQVRQQKRLRWIGLAAAILMNADFFHMVKVLSLDHRLRASLVTEAEAVADSYAKLHDSLREDADHLIGTFKRSDNRLRQVDDSLRAASTDESNRMRTLAGVLMAKDSSYTKVAHVLLANDSLRGELERRTDEVMRIASSLNLPIGFTSETAPLSWCRKPVANLHDLDEKWSPGLRAYNAWRNTYGFWQVAMYVTGILVTGIALSVGAPFWFSALTRLVNVRRTGTRPKNIPKA